MDNPSETQTGLIRAKEIKERREELWILLPIFLISTAMFAGSFKYQIEAAMLPLAMSVISATLSAMRLVYVLFSGSKIGAFKEEGLGGEFDSLKQKIKDELHVMKKEEPGTDDATFRKEMKAFLVLFGCFVVYFLLGYLIGTFFVIVGTSYVYGLKKKRHILISLIVMYVIVYVILYKLMGAPADYGLVGRLAKWVLKSLH